MGSQRPFVQVSRALPTDNGISDQIIQYKDVGTKLTVRPTISIDGTVQLNVTQEVSTRRTETAVQRAGHLDPVDSAPTFSRATHRPSSSAG